MLRPKRKISAKAVVRDIIAGADDFALMMKYRLAPKEFDRLFQKLILARVITETDLATREFSGGGLLCIRCSRVNPTHNKFCGQCGLELSWQCQSCGANSPTSVKFCTKCGALTTRPHEKWREIFAEKNRMPEHKGKVILSRILRDIRAGFGDNVLQRKYQLSRKGLARVFKRLAEAGAITHSELGRRKHPRSGLSCCTCGSSNPFESIFCGECGQELNKRCVNSGSLSPANRVSSPDLTSSVTELEQPEATTQTEPHLQDNFRPIKGIEKALLTVLAHLRKMKQSRKSSNEALYNACWAGRLGEVLHLLDSGADIDGDNSSLLARSRKDLPDNLWLQPLGIAAKNGHVDLAMLLLERGADVNKRGGSGLTTPLMETRSISVAQLLLDYGADIDAAGLGGHTALMSAASDGCIDLVSLLLNRGADVNAVNAEGDTALMCASQYNSSNQCLRAPAFNPDYPGVVKVLLAYGADVTVRNKERFTALTLADDYGHRDLVRTLREAGAREQTNEIDSNVLDLVIHMFRPLLDANIRHPARLISDISSARKSVKLNLALLLLSASMLAKLAHVDGPPKHAELSCFSRFITSSGWSNSFKLAADIFHAPINNFSNPHSTVASFGEEVGAFEMLFRNQGTTIKTFSDKLFSMASVDGPINHLEMRLLDLFVAKVGQTRCGDRYRCSDWERLREHDGAGIASSYLMLECKETDSDQHIRMQFRKLVKEYHPDAIQGKGLPADFIVFANRRLAEIQKSYKRIMDYRQLRSSKCMQ